MRADGKADMMKLKVTIRKFCERASKWLDKLQKNERVNEIKLAEDIVI